ncbi:MAG: hypothetical protein IKM88_13775 [Lachnospiraceae bacterium]|jgi:hypothetical protein|nr:hypothetical protein [Lachnospiraceae bacterium]
MKIAYICDFKDKCADRPGCFRHNTPNLNTCKHTFDPAHAANGAVLDPWNHPERFTKIDLTDDEQVFWEGDMDIP